VYVVELLNEEPISVNADRPLIAEQCIHVSWKNCKYGRARNLARRQRDYERTFGSNNVQFRYFSTTPLCELVEAVIGARLRDYRIRGARGRLSEWLAGIKPETVEAVVRDIVASLSENPVTPCADKVSRSSSLEHVTPTLVNCGGLVEAAIYLQNKGMSVELLRDLHHSPRRDETFKATVKYFESKSSLGPRNLIYGARIMYVAKQHQIAEYKFETLVSQALKYYPG
jgi:hypothetical protein